MPVTVGDLLDGAAARLRAAGVDTARLDARVLLGHAMDAAPESLLPGSTRPVSHDAAQAFQDLVDRRAAREPVSHLTGQREFYGRPFRVTPDVLDPRADSEVVVDLALSFVPDGEPARIADLGTGSGCLLLTLLAERPGLTGVGVDSSVAALEVARGNARALDLQDRATFLESDWLQGLAGRFDLIIANPPYIPAADIMTLAPEVRQYEPRAALDGGADGLDPYRTILGGAGPVLRPGGIIVVEHGFDQHPAVAEIAVAAGLEPVQQVCDLAGIVRGQAFRWPE